MNTRIPALVMICFLLSACAGVAKLPTCEESTNLKRINPEWISEVAEYSIPWDNHRDNDKEKLDNIEHLKKNKHPVKKEHTVRKTKQLKKATLKNKRKAKDTRKTKKTVNKKPEKKIDTIIKPKSKIKQTLNIKKTNLTKATNNDKKTGKNISKQKIKHTSTTTNSPGKKIPPMHEAKASPNKNHEAEAIKTGPKVEEINKPNIKKVPVASSNEDSWFLHAASYKNINFAQRHEKELLDDMFPAYIHSIKLKDTIYYRVIIGPKLTLEQARSFKDILFKKHKQNISIYNSKSSFKH